LSFFKNLLFPGIIPDCLKNLSSLEKRLITKINIFKTVVMLPGSQYAERGLVLNLPSNTLEVITKMPLSFKNLPFVVVHFDSENSCAREMINLVCQCRKYIKHCFG
jgi:hypothetical protein